MMPLIVRKEEITWSQTTDNILIKVPIKGIKANRTNIVTANNYIRVHFHPFIFEVFLFGDVDDERGNCTINEQETVIVFEMTKLEKNIEWASLEKQDLSRNEKRTIRDRAVEITQQRHADRKIQLEAKRHEQRQKTVRDQLEIDAIERERIVKIKQAESEKALSELHEWREEKVASEEKNQLLRIKQQQQQQTLRKTRREQRDREIGGKGDERIREEEGEDDDENCTECPPLLEGKIDRQSQHPGDASNFLNSQSDSHAALRKVNNINNNSNNNNSSTKTVCTTDDDEDEEEEGTRLKTRGKVTGENHLTTSSFLTTNISSETTNKAATNDEQEVRSRKSSNCSKGEEEEEEEEKEKDASPRGNNIWSKDEVRDLKLEGKTNGKGTLGNLPTTVHKNGRVRQERQPIRQAGHIHVSFTPREFPTPSRESTAPEEQEWLKKQAEARRKCGFNDADLRPEEKNPAWLLEKGRSLMETGSVLGAISAYSHGLKLAPKMWEFYLQRAEAHLNIKNLIKAVEDSSQALELLTPKIVQNAKDRLKCHSIRASGFRQLKCYKEALMDYKEALNLDPNDENLKAEFHSCEAVVYKMSQDGTNSSDEDD